MMFLKALMRLVAHTLQTSPVWASVSLAGNHSHLCSVFSEVLKVKDPCIHSSVSKCYYYLPSVLFSFPTQACLVAVVAGR